MHKTNKKKSKKIKNAKLVFFNMHGDIIFLYQTTIKITIIGKNIIVCIGEVRASLQVVPNLGHQKFVVLMHLSF